MTGLKYISLHDGSGYAHAARSYLRGLRQSGVPLTWQPLVRSRFGLSCGPVRGRSVGDPEFDAVCNLPLAYDTVLVHAMAAHHALVREPGTRRVGYTVWETDRLPPPRTALLNTLDLVLVPCQWNVDVCRRSGVTVPLAVVPHILDDPSPPVTPLPWPITDTTYVFYTIGTWTTRKDMAALVRAYLSAFTSRDPVLLVIKTTARDLTRRGLPLFRPTAARALQRLVAEFANPAPIRLIDGQISDAAMAALHQRGDCYVSLCHGEGWGLGAFDAAGRGKPVIMTRYGGQLDYLPEDLAYLVDCRPVPVLDPVWSQVYRPDQLWAQADHACAVRLMRQVFTQRAEAAERGRCLGEHVRAAFNSRVVTARLLAALKVPADT